MAFCFVTMNEVDKNYMKAQKDYSRKKDRILKTLKKEYDIAGDQFLSDLKEEYNNLANQKTLSEFSGREVKYETILKHIYSAAAKQAISILSGNSISLDEEREMIQQIQKNSELNIKTQHKLIEKEIDKIVKGYSDQISIDNLLNNLPQFMSSENKKLAADQIKGYYKKVLRTEAIKQLGLSSLDKKVGRYTSITLGYIKEDAMSVAANKVIEKLNLRGAKAQTVGAEKSHIDILISFNGSGSNGTSSVNFLQDLLHKLDIASEPIIEVGESKYNTEEFLGIQSKPWNIYRPESDYYKMAVGSRANLLSEYKELINNNEVDYPYSWHSGVHFLSQHLDEVIGANTVLYVTNNGLTWTDELLGNLLQLQKYFAFDLDKNHHITAMVVINQHVEHD